MTICIHFANRIFMAMNQRPVRPLPCSYFFLQSYIPLQGESNGARKTDEDEAFLCNFTA